MKTAKKQAILVACIIVTVVLPSCRERAPQDEGDTPIQESAWTGHPGTLGEWGHGADYIYGRLRQPDSQESLLVFWRWRGDAMKDDGALRLPYSSGIVPAANGICGVRLGREKGTWPFAILRLEDGVVLREWATPPHWWCRRAGGSVNGNFVAVVMDLSGSSPDKKLGEDYVRIGLIDVGKRERKWVGEIRGHGSSTIRRVVVTDDGRYVAIAGWNAGTAMVDTEKAQVIWAKRPSGEVGTGYAAFAPDGKTIFTAGSEGCVYEIEVTTGKVLGQRWATSTGKSIYAHRISALAISLDGKRLAAGTGPEGEVYVWDLDKKARPRVLHHGWGSICIVAFSPDARNLVSVGAGELKVWQLTPPDSAPRSAP